MALPPLPSYAQPFGEPYPIIPFSPHQDVSMLTTQLNQMQTQLQSTTSATYYTQNEMTRLRHEVVQLTEIVAALMEYLGLKKDNDTPATSSEADA